MIGDWKWGGPTDDQPAPVGIGLGVFVGAAVQWIGRQLVKGSVRRWPKWAFLTDGRDPVLVAAEVSPARVGPIDQ